MTTSSHSDSWHYLRKLKNRLFEMKRLIAIAFVLLSASLCAQSLTVYRSSKSVDATVEKIVEIIKTKKLAYFETVAHDKVAMEYGVEIPPTRMILFEDPNMMVELISCRQTTALDLPMKILVWEEDEDVYIGFFDPMVMKKRFMLEECEDIITSMSRLKVRIVNEALKAE